MSAIEVPKQATRTGRIRRASAIWSITAAVLFLGSAVLQLVASLQRWLVYRSSYGEFGLEDHLYDYSIPWDPWENIGTAAQFFGAGILLLAPGVLAMALGVLTMPRTTASRRAVVVIFAVVEIVAALLIAGVLAISGAHALISGVTGTPSPLATHISLGWIPILGLGFLTVRWARISPAAMMACLFLLGLTRIGHYIAAFQIAPIFAGYVSHDTTPWTETVIAVWTATAGVAMILAAADAARRERTRESQEEQRAT